MAENQEANSSTRAPAPRTTGSAREEQGAIAAGKPTFKTTFALVDVTAGRRELYARLKRGEKVRIFMAGTIQGAWAVGPDDGESREFCLDVEMCREIGDTQPF